MNKLTLLTLLFSGILIISLFTKKMISRDNYTISTEKIAAEIANDSTNILFVSLQDIPVILKNDKDYQIVDLRNKTDFENSHLENAINLPIDLLSKNASLSVLENEKQNILYADNYSLASNIVSYLKQIGIDNVKYLQANFNEVQTYLKQANKAMLKQANQENAKYDFNKYFNQPQKEKTPKMTIPTKPKVKRASGGC